jgi:hypothetical protein
MRDERKRSIIGYGVIFKYEYFLVPVPKHILIDHFMTPGTGDLTVSHGFGKAVVFPGFGFGINMIFFHLFDGKQGFVCPKEELILEAFESLLEFFPSVIRCLHGKHIDLVVIFIEDLEAGLHKIRMGLNEE